MNVLGFIFHILPQWGELSRNYYYCTVNAQSLSDLRGPLATSSVRRLVPPLGTAPPRPDQGPHGMPVAAPDRITSLHRLLPGRPVSRPESAVRAIPCERGGSLGHLGRVWRESVRISRRGQASPARTRGPGNAYCHKGGDHVCADCPGGGSKSLSLLEDRPPSLPARRLRPGRPACPAAAGARFRGGLPTQSDHLSPVRTRGPNLRPTGRRLAPANLPHS